MPGFSLPSFAKINLGLRVLGKRDDGFHDLFTVFQTVSLRDTLTFETSERLELTCSAAAIPRDENNLVIRAARSLAKFAGIGNPGAKIHLEKRIPSPGGLGGGSSNAAVALIGLSRLWHVHAEEADIAALASSLGSDVPFFLRGGTAIGSGRGTDLSSAADVTAKYILIVTPEVDVSTAWAFSTLDARNLTISGPEHILFNSRLEPGSYYRYLREMRNDFENTVFAAFPEIGRVKQMLLQLGAENALMSGSGASVFGLFDTEETRETALKALDEQVNWRKFSVATISRHEYREALDL